MTTITLTDDRSGLDGFPAAFTPIGRDELGDVLAVDGKGRVHSFEHGTGGWDSSTLAFASMDELHAYVAIQDELGPPLDLDLPALQARKAKLEAFAKGRRGAPYAREAVRAALESLREQISDRKFWQSKKGMALKLRHELGRRCEAALRDAGATGTWMVRPHVDHDRALAVVGPFDATWSEARVHELLVPVAAGHEVVCIRRK